MLHLEVRINMTHFEFINVNQKVLFSLSRWRSCDDKKFDNNFPAEKQYLITERVPCQKRIADVESAASAIQEVALEDGWFEARPPEDTTGAGEVVDIDAQMQVVDDMDN